MGHLLRALSYIGAPIVLMQLVSLVFMANGAMPQTLDMVEYFAGSMAVSCCATVRNGLVVFMAKLNVFDWWDLLGCLAGLWAQVTRCWSRCGFNACPFEINLQVETMDILSPVGSLGYLWWVSEKGANKGSVSNILLKNAALFMDDVWGRHETSA